MTEFSKMTPAETWEDFVGNQSVDEFIEMFEEFGTTDYADMAKQYAADIPIVTGESYTEEELADIADKLQEYIIRNMGVKKVEGKTWMKETIDAMLSKRRHELQAANCEEYRQDFERLKAKTVAEIFTLKTLVIGGATLTDGKEKEHLEELHTYLSLQSLEIERM